MKREPKPDDLLQLNYVHQMVVQLAELNTDIKANIWIGGLIKTVVLAYLNSGVSYEKFKGDMEGAVKYYKRAWKEVKLDD